ncbi:MAG: hydrogenase iron-sulfur subunit [Desulfotomaculales bacterium]
MSTEPKFRPKILGFVCNWCCYAGADLAGVSRFQYPPYIKLIRVMCSGRVDLALVFRAFANGADGVFIGGCWPGECHYVTEGNYHALSLLYLGRKLLASAGVNPARLRLEWVSASEGIRFAEVMNDFAAQITQMGPLGKGEGTEENELKSRFAEIINLLPYIRLVERERLRPPAESAEEYQKFFTSAEFARLFEETIAGKLALARIISLLQKGPFTAEEIAKTLGFTAAEAVRHLHSSVQQGLVRYAADQKAFVLA